MKVFERYFSKNKLMYFPEEFPGNISLIVVLPVFDDPDIFATLDSLNGCRPGLVQAGVIVVVNYPECCPDDVKERNRLLADEIEGYFERFRSGPVHFRLIRAFDLPAKCAGVGLARKIGMDQAAAYFYHSGNTEGVIASLDADTLVDAGYMAELVRFFGQSDVAGVTIAYEHRNESNDVNVARAMNRYELYLHYYQLALRFCGHPHAYHCIGSAFAVRVRDYVAQGGMNRRQAGEDFYFLQKLIATGRYCDLVSTRVFPSCRFSTRTPFGTGRSLLQIIEDGGVFPVYDFRSFLLLKSFFAGIRGLYRADGLAVSAFCDVQALPLRRFLEETGFVGMVAEVNANCASERQFVRRFFDNFNAFRVLKYLNFVHQEDFFRVDVPVAVNGLLEAMGYSPSGDAVMALAVLKGLTWKGEEEIDAG